MTNDKTENYQAGIDTATLEQAVNDIISYLSEQELEAAQALIVLRYASEHINKVTGVTLGERIIGEEEMN